MSEHYGGLKPEAYEEIPGDQYTPYIADDSKAPEFTIKGVVLGSIFGIMFGAANAYLGLRVGLTISTSIPIAVMTVAVFALLSKVLGKANILESNMAKTVGSASSSLASGIIFTVPAVWLWGLEPDYLQVSILAAIGGCLGVLFMVPLRRFLINEEHGKLPYPEGTASAEVLVAAERGGSTAVNVFLGMGVSLLYSFFWKGLQFWSDRVNVNVPFLKRAQASIELSPAMLGVGYILGFKIATIMVCGAALSALVIMPVIAHFFSDYTVVSMGKTVAQMDMGEMRNYFIRYIGAGAVASAGIISLIKNIPTMIKSFKLGIQKLRGGSAEKAKTRRTDRDLSIAWVGVGALIAIVIITAASFLFPAIDPMNFALRFGIGLLVVIFSFFFVTVSARIVGLVGVTSNPTSGMIIATLIITSLIFFFAGWTDSEAKATIIVIGTMIGVAASIAGDTSQDLKTGFLLGATPSKQQLGEILGVLTTAFFVAGTVFLLANQFEIGKDLPAPQANMMKLVVDGILDQSIPWILVIIGIGITVAAMLFRLPALAFAVGVYLPLATMAAIFVGGIIRLIVEKKYKDKKEELQERREGGILFGSGLVGGEGLMGVGIAAYAFIVSKKPSPMFEGWTHWLEQFPQNLMSLLPFIGLVLLLWMAIHSGKKKKA
jgi:putative OPT family oligopeptide transporter